MSLMKKFKPFTKGTTAESLSEEFDLNEKTFLITGCNSGIGFETARVLSLRGAKVIGTARTLSKAKDSCKKFGGKAIPLACDQSKPASIKKAIQSIDEPLDGIIANAGVMALQEKKLIHGVEEHMFINHISHLMLITNLLPLLENDGRVVVVSSAAHSYVRGKGVSFFDLGWDQEYKPWIAYGKSKLANILFVKELSKRLKKGQATNALHPGVIDTNLWRHLPDNTAQSMKINFNAKGPDQGAATSVFLAASPDVKGISGEYFTNGALGKPSAFAQDEKLARELWKESEKVAKGFY